VSKRGTQCVIYNRDIRVHMNSNWKYTEMSSSLSDSRILIKCLCIPSVGRSHPAAESSSHTVAILFDRTKFMAHFTLDAPLDWLVSPSGRHIIITVWHSVSRCTCVGSIQLTYSYRRFKCAWDVAAGLLSSAVNLFLPLPRCCRRRPFVQAAYIQSQATSNIVSINTKLETLRIPISL
jgi:hypothetical protein